jgi:hypothetical protein
MKSIESFESSTTLKTLHEVVGGKAPVILGYDNTYDKNGTEIDEDVITASGTGDCSVFWSGSNGCVDETRTC